MNICSVILAGGSGTRLWPLSRAAQPKQFLSVFGEQSLLQSTFNRLDSLNVTSTITVCNQEHRFRVAEQLQEIKKTSSIILEPFGRNTAPAIALAALSLEDDPLLLVMPADHVIEDEVAFCESISLATPLADSGMLVTFGIVPTEPHVGYGYIKTGDKVGAGYNVDSFQEKPSLKLAEQYHSSGGYFWNSGIFLFRKSIYLKELKTSRSSIYEICESAMQGASVDLDFIRPDESIFEGCPSDSIDYAVMENTANAAVVPINVGWNDVGSWSSLMDISEKDSSGNACHGDVLLHNSTNSYIRSEDVLVATIGIDNLVIVSTEDVLLVANKNNLQDIKYITQRLKDSSRTEWKWPRKVHRPWGDYDSISSGLRYQVKKIQVNPGAKLSLQMHHHRSEHWVVVSGTAKVTLDDAVFILREGESTYIPLGSVHSLENPGKIPLHLIEVQSGSYLGEDDIVRLEDRYGRK